MEDITMRKPFDIPSFHEAVKQDYEAKLITLEEAALEFYLGNWTCCIDMEYTKRKLGIA